MGDAPHMFVLGWGNSLCGRGLKQLPEPNRSCYLSVHSPKQCTHIADGLNPELHPSQKLLLKKNCLRPLVTYCRSLSSVGRAFDSVWWEHTSRRYAVRGTRLDGRSMLTSLLTGMVAVGGRLKPGEVSEGPDRPCADMCAVKHPIIKSAIEQEVRKPPPNG